MANGAGQAVQLATKLGEIHFPEFTASLITSTFDALLRAHIYQMRAYADILEEISMTLDEYVNTYRETVSDEDIAAWLEERGLPNIPSPVPDSGIPITQGQKTIMENLFLEDGESLNTSQSGNGGYTLLKDDDTDSNKVGAETVRGRVAEMILTRRYDLLREMVRMGLLRLVIDFGEIETKLLFSVYGVSTSGRATYDTVIKRREGQIGGGLSIKRKRFALSLGGYYRGSSIRVRTSSTYDRDTTGSKVDIFGRVYIRFKSDYAPLNTSEE